MNTMNNKYMSELLKALLNLERMAVGVKLHLNEDSYMQSESKEIVRKIAYCTMVRNATKGTSSKATLKNFACLGAARALGLMDSNVDIESGRLRVENGSYKGTCVSRSVSKDMNYIGYKVYGVEVRPLENYIDDNPDIVIIIGNSYATMRIIQGRAYERGMAKNIKIAGMQAICHEVTANPYENNELNISFMCSGTRMLCQWKESEIATGIPYEMLGELVMGIKSTLNPFERDAKKKIIEKNLINSGIDNCIEIEYGKNYDDGAYYGI